MASADGAVVGITLNDAAPPDLSTTAGETSLTPFVFADLVLEVDEARIARRRLQELLLLLRLLLLLGRRLRLHLLLGLGLRLVRRHPLRLELRGGLLDRLLLLLLLLGLKLVELLLVVVGGVPSKSTAIRSGPLMPGPKPLRDRS